MKYVSVSLETTDTLEYGLGEPGQTVARSFTVRNTGSLAADWDVLGADAADTAGDVWTIGPAAGPSQFAWEAKGAGLNTIKLSKSWQRLADGVSANAGSRGGSHLHVPHGLAFLARAQCGRNIEGDRIWDNRAAHDPTDRVRQHQTRDAYRDGKHADRYRLRPQHERVLHVDRFPDPGFADAGQVESRWPGRGLPFGRDTRRNVSVEVLHGRLLLRHAGRQVEGQRKQGKEWS